MQAKVRKLPKSEIEIEGEIPSDIFESYFARALKKIGENFELDGFRKGKVPDSVLSTKVPEARILETMAELALGEHYPKLLESEGIAAISRPEISITKLARKNPLGFKIKTAVLPAIKLPDYKKIAKKVLSKLTDKDKDTSVTDEEVEKTIMDIRKSRAPKKSMPDVAAEDKDTASKNKDDKSREQEDLPELNDEFVRGLGPFENVADFRTKLKENIKLEKANQNKEKTRLKILEEVIKDSELEVPEILVGIELDKILYKMEADVSAMGLKFEDYLKHLKKTKDDLRTEFRGDGEKKAKLGLILNEIARIEKVVADEKEIVKEVDRILGHYKDADPERARIHVENVLTNELIFQLLESQ